MMTFEPEFRRATPDDASDLAVLFDIASRRLISWYWGVSATPGQSWFEIGRDRIRNNAASDGHFTNWHVALRNGSVAGALNSHMIAEPYDTSSFDAIPLELLAPNQLEAVAEGTYYIFVAAVFPDYRGQGIGTAMLNLAQSLAREAGAARLTIMAESFNVGAHRLYLRHGFREWERRPFVPFPGCAEAGDWVLLVKDLD